MTQNDFLAPLFTLSPLLVALIVWFWGFGSLVLVGFKTRTIRSIVLKTPGIIIGDFFLIPITGSLITYFYQNVSQPLNVVSSPYWTIITATVALALTLVSAIRFKLISVWFIPHGLFYWFMAYIIITFLSKGIYQLLFGGGEVILWVVWGFALILPLAHNILGIIRSKRFPL